MADVGDEVLEELEEVLEEAWDAKPDDEDEGATILL